MALKTQRDIIYVCSHAENGGIYCFDVSEDGTLNQISFKYADRPAYATISDGYFYALLREAEPMQSAVNKYFINESYMLEKTDTMLTHGSVAAHLCIHEGKIYCVNYLSGSCICFPDKNIVLHDGKGSHERRQTSPHPHQIIPTPGGKYLVVNDLGNDTVSIYTPGLEKLKSRISAPAGSGPRHGIFSPDGKFYYCVGELDSTLSLYSYSCGRLKYISSCSTVPAEYKGENTASAIRIRNGYIYVSNRGHDSVCVLKKWGNRFLNCGFIDSHGSSPREFNFCRDYMICGNEGSSTLTVFKMREDGMGEYCSCVDNIVNPWCIVPHKANFSYEETRRFLDF
ncbi:MAG: beta-propeller fold lactonase family protein [Clostridia bacterium]|nr:beta-propeller fold lactonase family protein [Clostridia bacterium]